MEEKEEKTIYSWEGTPFAAYCTCCNIAIYGHHSHIHFEFNFNSFVIECPNCGREILLD